MCIFFLGVIFSLKFITTFEDSEGYRYLHGFRVSPRYATWIELIAIHILVPNASFMGHCAGVLAGIVYTNTFVGTVIDAILCLITGRFTETGIITYNFQTISSWTNLLLSI